jgi:chaperonin GroEL (HSP60 family)
LEKQSIEDIKTQEERKDKLVTNKRIKKKEKRKVNIEIRKKRHVEREKERSMHGCVCVNERRKWNGLVWFGMFIY